MPIAQAIDDLTTLLGERVSLSKPDLEAHGASESYFPNTPPQAVTYPRTTEEVRRIVEICARESVPVIGWGAGTSLEGHGQALQGGVSVDFRLMNKVLEIRPADMDVTVQPGVTREALNEELRATGLFFPVDPGANASLGGMAATPKRAATAEHALLGQAWSEQAFADAAAALAQDFTPLSDWRASSDYRSLSARNLLRRFFLENDAATDAPVQLATA